MNLESATPNGGATRCQRWRLHTDVLLPMCSSPMSGIRRSASSKQISSIKFGTMTVSKWLCQEEESVFCNVMESGDIVETELSDEHQFGIGLRVGSTGGEKGPDAIQVAYFKKSKGKVVQEPLKRFWVEGARIRINNKSDRDAPYHNEEDIRKQVAYALKNKHQKWHNSEHLAHWCRHGEKVSSAKIPRQVSEMTRWGGVTATMGVLMFMKKKRYNTQ
uniref:Uncharacterized protein n=1 Tax=Timema tahoe TaxID=61484 RepID=A0A7R9ILU6_9NEOP|nr:unnamed protein product [Timema tahoe]